MISAEKSAQIPRKSVHAVDNYFHEVYNDFMENLTLIGMPSAGKSTVGRLLAERMNYAFLDCDALIIAREGPLSELIEKRGVEEFLRIEERICSQIEVNRTVIAPGGSVCYSERAMEHFLRLGKVVYLKIGLEEVKRRIGDFKARGVAMRGKINSLDVLYAERVPLLERWAQLTVSCDGKTAEEIAEEIMGAVTV